MTVYSKARSAGGAPVFVTHSDGLLTGSGQGGRALGGDDIDAVRGGEGAGERDGGAGRDTLLGGVPSAPIYDAGYHSFTVPSRTHRPPSCADGDALDGAGGGAFLGNGGDESIDNGGHHPFTVPSRTHRPRPKSRA